MTEKEKATLEVVANDVKWIKETMVTDGRRISNIERIVYIGLGICLMGEIWLGFIK